LPNIAELILFTILGAKIEGTASAEATTTLETLLKAFATTVFGGTIFATKFLSQLILFTN
jgi:hypothetical protein